MSKNPRAKANTIGIARKINSPSASGATKQRAASHSRCLRVSPRRAGPSSGRRGFPSASATGADGLYGLLSLLAGISAVELAGLDGIRDRLVDLGRVPRLAPPAGECLFPEKLHRPGVEGTFLFSLLLYGLARRYVTLGLCAPVHPSLDGVLAYRAEGPRAELSGLLRVLAFGVGDERPAAEVGCIPTPGRQRELEQSVLEIRRVRPHVGHSPDSAVLYGTVPLSQVGHYVVRTGAKGFPRRHPALDCVLPELESLYGTLRVKGTLFAGLRHNVAATLPHEWVPGEILIVARVGIEQ